MVNTYVLVNPLIQGKFKSTTKAKNSIEAGKELYTSLSSHFNNAIPEFKFTIQKGGSGNGKFYHFRVKEKKSKSNEVGFSIEPIALSNEQDQINKFKGRKEKFVKKLKKMEGGKSKKSTKKSKKSKKDDSSDDSSDSDSDILSDKYKTVYQYVPNYNTYPLFYWWYDPLVYGLDSLFIPTFYSYVTPFIEIDLHP